MNYFMGIDLGTQGVRVGVFDEKGNQHADVSKGWETMYPNPGWAEQDPNEWWRALQDCFGELSKTLSSEIRQNIVTATVDATASTSLPIDKNYNAISNAIMWMDMRATAEAEVINATNHEVLKHCGGEASPEWFVPKLLWVKKNKNSVFSSAYKFIDQLDWINYKLCGVMCACMCTVVCKYHYVEALGGYVKEFYDSIGLPEWNSKVLEDIRVVGSEIAPLKDELCELYGFSKNLKLLQGGVDAHVGVLGTNAFQEGQLSVNMGTSFCILGNINKFSDKINSFWGPYKDAIVPGAFCIEGGQSTAAGLVNWFIRNFNIEQEATVNVYEYLDTFIAQTSPGAGGLICLDHFQGNRTPYKDANSRGIIYGLTMQHSKKEIYRAILEGVAFGTYNIIDRYNFEACEITEIVACGGGSKNKAWVQMIADICGKPIIVNKCEQGGVLGCCIIGAANFLYDGNYKKAADSMVVKADVYEPNMDVHMLYEPIFARYLALYKGTKDISK